MWKKTVIHIPKLRVPQYLFLFDFHYYLKLHWSTVKSWNKKEFCFGKKAKMIKSWRSNFSREELTL